MQPHRWRRVAAVFASYALVALVATFPMIRHPATAFPGTGDDVFSFIWNNWWIHYAITQLHDTPYVTSFIFAPFTVDLRLHALGMLYGLIALPFMRALGPVAVLNAQILGTIVVNGYAANRLTAYVTRSAAAGFVAGVLIAATPAINFHLVLGRASYAALWPAIFALLAFLRLLDRPDWRTSAWLAAALLAMLLSDQQAAMFGICWLLVLGGFTLAVRRGALMNQRVVLAAGAVAAIVIVPAYLLYVRPFAGITGYTVPAAAEALHYSYPPRFLWSPSMFWNVYGTVMPLGLVAALLLIRRVPVVVPWLCGSGLFIAFSLGPVATGTRVPLPFSVAQALPLLAQFRTPYRFQIAAAIGLAVTVGILVSYGLEHLNPTWKRLLLIGVVGCAAADLAAVRIVSGFRLRTMPRETVYEEIARDPRDCLVLEVPVGVRTGTDRIGPGESLSFYQPIHHKRIINGLVARGPLAALEYYRASPAIMFLAHETPPGGDVVGDLRRRLRELAVGYVVIHPGMMTPAWLEQTVDVFGRVEGLRRLDTSSGTIAFRVDVNP